MGGWGGVGRGGVGVGAEEGPQVEQQKGDKGLKKGLELIGLTKMSACLQ